MFYASENTREDTLPKVSFPEASDTLIQIQMRSGVLNHTIILITHFHPNRSFPELTFLHRVSVAFFNIHHFREEKKKLGKKDIRKILYKNRFERARLALLSVLVN